MPIDMSTLDLHGNVGLSSGVISGGSASLNLDSKDGANQLAINGSNGEYSVASEKLAAAAIQLHSGGMNTSVSQADLQQAEILYKQNGGDIEATLSAIRMQGLSVTRKH